jgi:hypothetical protein
VGFLFLFPVGQGLFRLFFGGKQNGAYIIQGYGMGMDIGMGMGIKVSFIGLFLRYLMTSKVN